MLTSHDLCVLEKNALCSESTYMLFLYVDKILSCAIDWFESILS